MDDSRFRMTGARSYGAHVSAVGRSLLAASFFALTIVTSSHSASTGGDAGAPEVTPRIIGGNVSAGEWPSLGALLFNAPGRPVNLRQFCGGTLIAPTWYLTAAHCVTNEDGSLIDAFNMSVMFGQLDLNLADGAEEIPVLNVIRHPDYLQDSYTNDIALLELSSAANQPTIALYQGSVDSLTNSPSFVAGWGAFEYINDDERSFDGVQRFAQVPIVSRDECNKPASYNGTIDNVRFCAGLAAGGVDSCAGDSGGPLIVGVEQGGVQIQVQAGIVSYGVGCALPDKYGVYSDVANFRAWVSQYATALFLPRTEPADDPAGLGGGGGGGGATDLVAALILLLGSVYRRRTKLIT